MVIVGIVILVDWGDDIIVTVVDSLYTLLSRVSLEMVLAVVVVVAVLVLESLLLLLQMFL